MRIESRALSHFADGIVLEVIADDLPLRAYVAICDPDPEAVTAFVPPEQFENGSNLHVAAIDTADEAAQTIEDVLFNMDPNDAVALLCGDRVAWGAALELLGYVSAPGPLK